MKRLFILFLVILTFLTGCSLSKVDEIIEPEEVQNSYNSQDEPVNEELDLNKRYENLIGEHKAEGQDYMSNAFEYEKNANDNRTTEEKIYDMGNKVEFFNEVVIRKVIDNSRAIFIFLLLVAMLAYVFFKHDKARQQTAVKFILVIIVFIIIFSFVSDF
jgi:hypothetical protein